MEPSSYGKVSRESLIKSIQDNFNAIERLTSRSEKPRLLSRESLTDSIQANLKTIEQLALLSGKPPCEELFIRKIIEYLKYPSSQTIPTFLGLDPQQIDLHPSELHISLFKKLVQECKTIPSYDRSIVSNNLKEYYPNIYKKILAATIVEGLENFPVDGYEKIYKRLQKGVIAQEQALKALAGLLASQKLNFANGNEFCLFIGPSGVGKTELAKAVANVKTAFVRIKMDMLQHDEQVFSFWGSPVGYVGSADKPRFAKELDKCNPIVKSSTESLKVLEVVDSVLLFEAFSRAAPKIKQLMLTLFDEGIYRCSYTTDSANTSLEYGLKNCVVILVSNLYQEEILEAFQRKLEVEKIKILFEELNLQRPQPNGFPPELVSRMKIIPFGPIPRGTHYQSILKIKIDEFVANLKSDFNFRVVKLIEESLILQTLEKKLYGRGVSIRALDTYFTGIKQAIQENQFYWGPSVAVMLEIFVEGGQLFIRPSTTEAHDGYHQLEKMKIS